MKPMRERAFRLVPSSRLERRLGLAPYHVHPPFAGEFEPAMVRVSMRQHIGAPAVPVVREGQSVEREQLLGGAKEGALSVNVHAPLDGVVRAVSEEAVEIVASTAL